MVNVEPGPLLFVKERVSSSQESKLVTPRGREPAGVSWWHIHSCDKHHTQVLEHKQEVEDLHLYGNTGARGLGTENEK